MARTVAYLRVSTDRQDAQNQRLEILDLANRKGLGKVQIVEEVISGRKSWRERKLGELLSGLGSGDALVVAELSRLGRSMLEVMEVLSVATQAGVEVYASKGDWHLDRTLQSRILAMVLAMAAEIERDLISKRTKAALETRRSRGLPLGRPRKPGKSKLDDHAEEIHELLSLGVTKRKLAKRFNTSYSNLRHWLGRHPAPAAKS